jgi:hypothetical protein
VHTAQLLVVDCNYPKGIVIGLCVNATLFFYMFAQFFKRNYIKSDPAKKDIKSS